MAPKGTVYKRCSCKHPDTGKPLNQRCPRLTSSRHGTWTLDVRLDTTDKDGRRLKRAGWETKKTAEAALDHVRDLVKLAADDDRMRRRIGDLIFERSKRGGQLPEVEEIRRRLGAGVDLAAVPGTVAEWLEQVLTAKRRKLAESSLVSYRGHMDHYLIPMLGEIPRDNLRPEHIVHMFDTIDEWNSEILRAQDAGEKPVLPDDVRKRKKLVGPSTYRHILKVLSAAYNVAVKRPGMINWNPCLAVELPPARPDPARVWGPDEVALFLAGTEDDPLGLVYRIVLLRGPRRGEVLGIRLDDLDDDEGGATIRQTILEVSGRITVGTPKTRAGERWLSFDEGTTQRIRARMRARRHDKLAAGEAYDDRGLLFARADGTPWRPSGVSWAFRRKAVELGLPPIRFHDARHTAATLALEADVDIKIVSEQLGHSNTAITRDLYTHVRRVLHEKAAAKVLGLIPKQEGSETG